MHVAQLVECHVTAAVAQDTQPALVHTQQHTPQLHFGTVAAAHCTGAREAAAHAQKILEESAGLAWPCRASAPALAATSSSTATLLGLFCKRHRDLCIACVAGDK